MSMATTVTQRKIAEDLDDQHLFAKSSEHAGGAHDFFWTYTEEPHRTRRQEIIKAHPEVKPLNRPLTLSLSLLILISGYKALWPGTLDKVCRCVGGGSPTGLCFPSSIHCVLFLAIFPDSLFGRCDQQSKSVPRDPRNLSQPRFQVAECQSDAGDDSQLTRRHTLLCLFPTVSFDTPQISGR